MHDNTLPDSIHAAIDPGAIGKVSRFFDASSEQIIGELLQNARRAGATKVAVTCPREDTLRIVDDGAGIADPRSVLAFGRSGWDEGTVAAEDPAGMGIFSLARRRARIASRPTGGAAGAAGWQVQLEPEHFVGQVEAAVGAAPDAPRPHGTLTEFAVEETRSNIRHVVADAARHYPLPVSFDGREVERQGFLDKAVHVAEWRGVRIGVHHSSTRTWARPQINFHGHLIDCDKLPVVTALPESGTRIDTWWVLVDVVDRNELELVLPARKQVVVNAYLQQLTEACEESIYNAIAISPERPYLDHGTWSRALSLGVKLPRPEPRLRAWRPRSADEWDNEAQRHDPWTELPSENAGEALLMNTRMRVPDEHVLHRALRHAGLLHRTYAFDSKLASYGWCRQLRRITEVDVRARFGERTVSLREARENSAAMPAERPERIEVALTIVDAEGNRSEEVIETDTAFWWVETREPHEIEVLLTEDGEIRPDELADLMVEAFFYAKDDVEADSAVTQRAAFRRGCREVALTLLGSGEAARQETIRDIVEHYLVGEIRNDEDVHVHVQPGGKVEVSVHGAAA